MITIARSIDAMQKAEEVLQDIVSDLTTEWFTGSEHGQLGKTGRRMLDIGALLYGKPRDFLHICLWEAVSAAHPETNGNMLRLRAVFRPDTWGVAESVHEHTTWSEFEQMVMGGSPEGGFSSSPKVIPIHH